MRISEKWLNQKSACGSGVEWFKNQNEKEADQFLKCAEDNIVAGQEEQSRNILKDARAGKCPILL